MRVLNDIDRFDLVIDTVRRLPQLGNRGAYLVQRMQDKLVEHRQYIRSRSPMWSARTRRFPRSLSTLPPSP